VMNAQGVVCTQTSRVMQIDSAFNGALPASGVCPAIYKPGAVRQTLYLAPNFATGTSNLRFVTNSEQFNWDTTSAQTVNGGSGKGCYLILIYPDDRGVSSANPRVTSAVQLN